MAGWRHQLIGHEFEQAPGVGDGQGGLACCSPWGRKELDTTEQLNSTHNAGDADSIPGLGRSPREEMAACFSIFDLGNRALQATIHGLAKESDRTE